MRAFRLVLVLVATALLVGACGEGPRVVQGQVVSVDNDAKILVIKDEQPPGNEIRLEIEGAELGAETLLGDEVRVAYREVGGRNKALRVMNLTRQAEFGKKAKSGGGEKH
ncbi:MAG: hypothetical protein V1750_02455 [Acidobacteriota bacterium]